MLWPPPDDPYFHSRSTLIESIPGREGKFGHFTGHSRDVAVRGKLRKRHRLHLAVDFDLADTRLKLSLPGLKRLPLLHPFRHDGGAAEYRVVSDDVVELLAIEGPIIADWPYENYPEQFAPRPFDLKKPRRCTFEDFDGTTMQGVDRPGDEPAGKERFIVVLPDFLIDGEHGVWSPGGGECVNALFIFEPATRIVRTFNETD